MDQPDFNAVFAQFAPSLHLVDSERRAERVHEAHDMFALFVQSAITDAQTQSVMLAQQLSDPQAKRFMSYGTGRRFGMIRAAFKSIRGLVPSDRIAPLPIEKVGAVSRDLNVIYINVRGTIDNYAWCLRH